ncbi:hypothetical protein MF271_22585 (plasmid) [Deinococcus sp. KNUC1210]|uniref:hypothetical protein n=1 Tax=Deinococcus sp. KNUC1210 TaxID=2917691 RepID=UPI001EF059FF|nr:hypothetical protein [Deinococcus sp. KNUC1210]ULH18256.1 hypothetical protein MF271_22585 [Deinococcus sp. KNUC1210]
MVAPTLELPDHALRGFEPASTYASTAIWWHFEDISYPAAHWYDNPGVILLRWATELSCLAQGARMVQLQFMEGPFALTLRTVDGNLIEVSAPDLPTAIVVTMPDLVQAVQNAMTKVAPAFERTSHLQHVGQGLRQAVDELDRLLRFRHKTNR